MKPKFIYGFIQIQFRFALVIKINDMLNKVKSILPIFFLSVIFLTTFYGKVLFSPNSYLFSSDGDGMKNYYTYAYYISKNNSNIEFEGMNYPFQEHFMYTDCHPAMAFFLKITTSIFPSLSHYAIGILNLTLLLSLVLTSLLLYLIFRKIGISQLISTLGAFSIMVLSPQLFRLTGHLSLSYSFFIPLTIYLILLFEEKEQKKQLVFLGLSILIFFFTHAYLGIIATAIIAVYASIGFLINFIYKKPFSKYIFELAAAIIPLGLFYAFVKLTDTHVGRTDNPWGIHEYHAELSTVFLPVRGTINKFLNSVFGDLGQGSSWEGWAYIGLIALAALTMYIISFFKKNNGISQFSNNRFINLLFLTSAGLLCYALLLPFRSLFLYIIDHLGPIKQFRSVGRFAWVFYFVINIIAIYGLDLIAKYLLSKKKKLFAYSLIVLIPFITILEGIGYHSSISKQISKSPNVFESAQLSEELQIDFSEINPDNYQALIALPFFHFGSENFDRNPKKENVKLALLFSYHLNLPMFNGFTRTPVINGKKILQLFSSDFYKKEIEADIIEDKPILIVCSNEELKDADRRLLKKSSLIKKQQDYSIYEIDKKSLFKNTSEKEFEKFNLITENQNYHERKGFLVSDTSLFFLFDEFKEYYPPNFIKNSNGCYGGLQRNYNVFLEFKGSMLNPNRTYITRFWMYNNGKNNGQDRINGLIFFEKTSNGKSEWLHPTANGRKSQEINGDWSLVEIPLLDVDTSATYKLIVKGDYKSEDSYYIDDLLFTDAELNIYKLWPDSVLFQNNHKIILPKE